MQERTKDKKLVTLNELENKEKQELKKIFLHFTRKNNQESIEKIGLNPNVKKENAVGNDKEVPVVYFSEGLDGMFEILNTWVRTEYYMNVQLKRRMGIDVKFGHEEVDSDILKEVYEKMYTDLKDRIYYSVELKEGIDYEEDGIDDKKVDLKTRLENNDIPEYIVEDVKWQYGDGEYGNFDDIKQEKWNRNTICICSISVNLLYTSLINLLLMSLFLSPRSSLVLTSFSSFFLSLQYSTSSSSSFKFSSFVLS